MNFELGFDKIINHIKQFAVSETGRLRISKIQPLANQSEILRIQERISCLRTLLDLEEDLPISGFEDIRGELERCRVKGSYLMIEALVDIKKNLEIVKKIIKFYNNRRENLKSIAYLIKTLSPLPHVHKIIHKLLDSEYKIRDNASPNLAEIRKQINSCITRLHKEIGRTMENARRENWLHEENPTIRNGRLVLPIKAAYKRKVHGIIHGQSNTGITVFIEPLIMVEINNQLKELEQDEKDEIRKILQNVTSEINPFFKDIEQNIIMLAELDFCRAGASFSKRFNCTAPIISDSDRRIILKGARHPLLTLLKKVVPLDFSLQEDILTVVITGPNAGGKTVAMKTIGLLGQMAISGLHIPANPGSQIPMFDRFLIDIGDSQSIENDLSTFSSHVTNLKNFLDSATDRSLVLVDELGTGTDPVEGSALAQAVLEKLIARGTIVIATTHHNGLKAFANDNKKVMNGAMEFDTNSLNPTYVLQMGAPGSSYALEISERLGLDSSVISRSREIIGSDSVKLENLLLEVENLKSKTNQKNRDLERNKHTLDKIIKKYEYKLEKVKEKQKVLDETLSGELDDLVKESRAKIEHVVKEIREKSASKETIIEARDVIKDLSSQVTDKQKLSKNKKKKPETDELKIGDWVKIEILGKSGVVVKKAKRNNRTAVEIEGKTLWLENDGLQRVENKVKTKQQVFVSTEIESSVTFRLDLRGKRFDEAQDELIKYLDSVVLSGFEQVQIIHGKGTGALQQMTHLVLKQYPGIKKYYFENFDQGGTGVTIVEL